MFDVSHEDSKKLVLMSDYKSEQKVDLKDEKKATKPNAVCEGGVCRLEWKPTRPSNGANAA